MPNTSAQNLHSLLLANVRSYCSTAFSATAVQRAEVTLCNMRKLHRSSCERHRAQRRASIWSLRSTLTNIIQTWIFAKRIGRIGMTMFILCLNDVIEKEGVSVLTHPLFVYGLKKVNLIVLRVSCWSSGRGRQP